MRAEVRTAGTGLRRKDMLWLGLAMFLHALLLLIPHRPGGDETRPSRSLSLSFLERAVTPPSIAIPERVPVPSQPPRETTSEPAEPAPGPERAALPEDEKSALPSAALLIEAANRFQWSLPEERTPRRLGIYTPREEPENWKNPLEPEANRFDDAVVPERVEIVDRWLAADGSHNVVVETPTGHTLCGRGEAWDPMNPLVEHVMQFRPCGGGGKRTFQMPHRYRVRNSLPDTAQDARLR